MRSYWNKVELEFQYDSCAHKKGEMWKQTHTEQTPREHEEREERPGVPANHQKPGEGCGIGPPHSTQKEPSLLTP